MGSYAESVTEQKDQRLTFGEDAPDILVAPEGILTQPGGQTIAIGAKGYYTPHITTTEEFTPEVAATIKDILDYANQSSALAFGLNEQAVNGILAIKAEQTEQAQAGDVPDYLQYLPYAALALILVLLIKR